MGGPFIPPSPLEGELCRLWRRSFESWLGTDVGPVLAGERSALLGGEVHGGEEVRGEAKEEVLYRRNI